LGTSEARGTEADSIVTITHYDCAFREFHPILAEQKVSRHTS
jgi:hypothetical protein